MDAIKDGSCRIHFIPHDIAKDDQFLCITISSFSSFDEYKLRKVYVTPAGKIKEHHEQKHN